MVKRALYVWLGLVTGSFIFQMVNDQDWQRAIERSFFMGFAIAMVLLFEKLRKPSQNQINF